MKHPPCVDLNRSPTHVLGRLRQRITRQINKENGNGFVDVGLSIARDFLDDELDKLRKPKHDRALKLKRKR